MSDLLRPFRQAPGLDQPHMYQKLCLMNAQQQLPLGSPRHLCMVWINFATPHHSVDDGSECG